MGNELEQKLRRELFSKRSSESYMPFGAGSHIASIAPYNDVMEAMEKILK